MNEWMKAGRVLMLACMLTGLNAAFASTMSIRPPGSSTSPDGSSDSGVAQVAGTLELVATVIKNEKLEVSGNAFGGVDASSLTLLDSPAGTYGLLDISNGVYRYVLRNDAQPVQALGPNEVVQEVFNYQLTHASGARTDVRLTVFILGNPSVSFDNVEIEFNDRSSDANPIHAGNSQQPGQIMRGQLSSSSDQDWFIFNSLGNEIINIALCPEGSSCMDENSWVLYVFDADRLAQHPHEDRSFPLRWYSNDTFETLSVAPANHPYLLYNKGFMQNSLIGIIDPCFGNRRTVDIGVGPQPKNYLVLISSPLLRDGEEKDCASGDVVLTRDGPKLDTENGTTEEFIVAYPFSDDQYSFSVTRTGADPFAVLSPHSTQFDAIGRRASVPLLRANNQLYAVELEQVVTAQSAEAPATFAIQSVQLLDAPATADPYQATYNPANQIVKLPQVVDAQSGALFSVELLLHPANGTLTLLKAEPIPQ